MTKARAAIHCPRDPVGLGLDEAATFVGMSPSLFERLVRDGVMPWPRQFAGRRIWDADEIVAAFRRVPHRAPLDLKPGTGSRHDIAEPADIWDEAPRA